MVLVTVDQLRGDLIDRFDPVFDDGFRRLLDEGFVYTAASHNHSSTSTAIGHTTLATGRHPVTHGIVGNSWAEHMADGSLREVYAVEDTMSEILDHPTAEGRSPRNIRSTTLADWLLTESPASRTLAVSLKDRAAIATAGQARDHHVYWWMQSDGRFVSSSWYIDDYPDWVQRFNREKVPELIADSIWEHTVSPEWRSLAREDEAAYEADGVHTTFTHRRDEEVVRDRLAARNLWWRATPFADRAVLRFTQEAMRHLELGRRGVTDYLSVSFSATDYVGHKYGPLSQEQLANLDALDHTLGELFDALDAQVGEGRWVLALSADHGVLTAPEHRVEMGEAGYRITREDQARMDSLVVDAASTAFAEGADTLGARRAIARRIEELPFVADVIVPEDDLLTGEPADSFLALYRRAWTAGRRQGIEAWDLPLRLTEGAYAYSSTSSTGHGSPYWYDRWVPVIFMGRGIEPGRSDEAIFTVDVAPTLAHFAHLSPASGLDGRALVVGEQR
ncbi:MAG: alkaline phosphatase family protein [Longimicrobiales bacterium]|nr:alkaline phosphatase family protein [Longimicrobiales bacterium]